ncbi:MAG: hypothetical protein WEB00_06935 [Dehalococcoidia bacterium]
MSFRLGLALGIAAGVVAGLATARRARQALGQRFDAGRGYSGNGAATIPTMYEPTHEDGEPPTLYRSEGEGDG